MHSWMVTKFLIGHILILLLLTEASLLEVQGRNCGKKNSQQRFHKKSISSHTLMVVTAQI